jgi:hypothetical protein
VIPLSCDFPCHPRLPQQGVFATADAIDDADDGAENLNGGLMIGLNESSTRPRRERARTHC